MTKETLVDKIEEILKNFDHVRKQARIAVREILSLAGRKEEGIDFDRYGTCGYLILNTDSGETVEVPVYGVRVKDSVLQVTTAQKIDNEDSSGTMSADWSDENHIFDDSSHYASINWPTILKAAECVLDDIEG